MKKNNIAVYLSYATVYVVWGSTYFFIKMAVETIPPLVLVSYRWTLGGFLFLIYYYARHGFTLPTKRELVSSIFMGMLLIFIPNSIVSIAECKMDSYIAALIMSLAPIVVAFFDRYLLGKRISLLSLTGMVIGIIGIAILIYNGSSLRVSFSSSVFLLLAGLVAFSFATSTGHKINNNMNTVLHTGYQMLFSGLISFVWFAISEPGQISAFGGFSARSIFALCYLATLGSIAYGAYIYLIKHEPSARVTSYALVNPVIAVFLGIVIGREAPARYIIFGIPVVLAGLSLMMYGEQLVAYLKAKLYIGRAIFEKT